MGLVACTTQKLL